MKTTRLKSALLAGVAALALAPAASFAASDILIQPVGSTVMSDGFGNQTSSSGGGGVWQNWFINAPGITNYSITYDIANPPPTGSAGSMKQTQGWDGTAGGTLSTFACVDGNFWGGTKVNMTEYEFIEMDFKYDTTSDMLPVTDRGFDFGVNAANNSSSVPINLRLIYNTGTEATNFDGAWHHLITAIPANISNAEASEGPGFKIFHPVTTTGSFNYWIANLKLVARIAPIAPPTITLEKTAPGLRQFADALPDYNRNNIRTDTTPVDSSKNVDWVGHPGASYSWTVSEFPGAGHANFHMAMTFTPDPAETINFSDPDWGSTNALWFEVQANVDGTVRSALGWKTNQPSGNSQYGSTGSLFSGLNSPTGVGTWTLTFVNDTSVTLTAPGGVSTNVTLPAGMFAIENGYTNISVALYSGMNNGANIGQYVTLTSYQISGVQAPFNESLTDGALNTSFLRFDSQGYSGNLTPPNQVFTTSSDAYWLHWTLPDGGFTLVEKTNLTDAFWLDYAPANILLNGGSRWVKLSSAALPSPNSSLFALLKRDFTKLQVLFPWETPAPNTPTGKTGTQPANSVSLGAGGTVDVTVRAVDANWNLVSSGNTVLLSTTDLGATIPPAKQMVAGSVVFNGLDILTFSATNTYTVSATNTSIAMPLGTSSPIIVVE